MERSKVVRATISLSHVLRLAKLIPLPGFACGEDGLGLHLQPLWCHSVELCLSPLGFPC